MAVSKDQIKTAYPLPVYNYKVEIGSDTVAFSEVSGLGISYETTTYKESPIESGTPGPRVMQMPAQRSPPTITLKKGIVLGASVATLYSWISGIQTKLDAPSFDANSNDVAVESMELTADSVSIEEA